MATQSMRTDNLPLTRFWFHYQIWPAQGRTIFRQVEAGGSSPWNQSESGLSEDIWKSLCRWFDSAPGHQETL